MQFRSFLLTFFAMSSFLWFGTNPLTQVTYPKSLPNRLVQVGTSYGTESLESVLHCGRKCLLERRCVGFNFRRNISDVVGGCDVRLGGSDVGIPSSVSENGTYDFYGGLQNPLSKYEEFCEPLDKDLTFDCSEISYVPGSCSGKLVCDVRSNTLKRRFVVYASKSSTSLLAPLECCSKGEQLARIDSATVQSWFCHVLHNMCGSSSKGHAFTFAMYRYTVLGDPWRYLADGNPELPKGYYSNFYKPDPGSDRCAQMFSGDPYHFKWVQSTCDFATSKGRKYHCVCERNID